MLPFHLCAWETDATLRGAVQESVQVGLAPAAIGALLTGGEIAGDARVTGKRSVFSAEARARFARALDLAGSPPEDQLDADASASATFTTGPRSTLAITAQGSLGTSWGIRADSLLLAQDPFLEATRLAYGAAAELAYTAEIAPRAELAVDAGFNQEGALASEVAAVVGTDSREGRAGVACSIEAAPRLSITPELRWSSTHYTRALLDIDRRRGPADVHAITVALGASREVRPRLFVDASAGITAARSTLVTASRWPEMMPEASLGLRFRGRRAEVRARYAWSYSSLGPLVGAGRQHAVTVRVTAWPAREIMVRATLRAAHGSAPLAADAPAAMVSARATEGELDTTTVASRAVVEIPITRGWALSAGADLAFVRGVVTPSIAAPRRAITGMLTIGLGATVSTDKRRLYPRAPGADEDEATRRGGTQAGARREDRTGIDEGRGEER